MQEQLAKMTNSFSNLKIKIGKMVNEASVKNEQAVVEVLE